MISRRRFDAIDVARGLALVAMAAYHFTWDLSYFGVIDASAPYTPPMRIASHTIGGFFLALAGVSLALAHARGFAWRGYLKRMARIGAAAALVSLATYEVAPEAPIFFGILHCIFAGSVLGAAILLASGKLAPQQGGRGVAAVVASVVGLAMILAPRLWTSPLFDPPWLVWLGLGAAEPVTLDWRPLMPWAGVMLIGMAAAMVVSPPFPQWRATSRLARALSFSGRHSLAIYLIHQPILLGLLYGATELTGFNERQSVENYLRACRPACVEAGGEIETCNHACACVVRDAAVAGLSRRLGAHSLSKDERSRLGAIVDACGQDPK